MLLKAKPDVLRQCLVLLAAFCLSCCVAIESHAEDLRTPNTGDYIATGTGLGGLFVLNIFEERLGPIKPRLQQTNKLDASVRHTIHLENATARRRANIAGKSLLYGLYVPSLLVIPMAVDSDPRAPLNVMGQTVAINGIGSRLAAFTVARQRPYKTHGTWGAQGVQDNMSFYSQAVAHAFATATAGAMLLSHKWSDKRGAIWPAMLAPAAGIGVLQMMADQNYLTDVLVASLVGSATGFLVARGWDDQLGRKDDDHSAPGFPPNPGDADQTFKLEAVIPF